jgi:hypothetical protein
MSSFKKRANPDFELFDPENAWLDTGLLALAHQLLPTGAANH